MKKLLPLLVTVFLISSLFLATLRKAKAVDYILDQQNTTNISASSGALKIYSRHLGQTFKPEGINRISWVDIYIRYPSVGSWIEVEVVRADNGVTVTTGGTRMFADNDWETIGVTEAVLVPDDEYILYVNLDTNYNTMWVKSGFNAYSRGVASWDGSFYGDDDFGFKVWGYLYEEPEEPDPPDPVDGGEDDSDEGGEQQDDTQSEDNIPSEKQSIEDLDAEVDESIEPPVLGSLKKNDDEVDLEEITELDVNSNDTVEMSGTAFSGATVVVYIGDSAFSATADEEGNWTIIINVSDIESGLNVVEGQAQNDEGKGSEKVAFFSINKQVTETGGPFTARDTEEVELSLWEKLTVGSLRWISITVLSVLFLLFVGTWLFIVWKRDKKKGKNVLPKSEKPTTKEVKK
ncbi:hypothetical protein ACFLY9_01305 [Patescibacteria group bacterium]